MADKALLDAWTKGVPDDPASLTGDDYRAIERSFDRVRYVYPSPTAVLGPSRLSDAVCRRARDLADSIAELRQIADGHDDVIAEAADISAGAWYAWPSTRPGFELVAAEMLIMAGGHDGKPMDYAELERWTRVGFERG